MQKRIYLVRHGDKVKMAGDPPLTDLGVKQAQATAVYFSQLPVEQIVASPLLRAQQTAEIIALPHNLPIVTDQQLVERANWGDNPQQSFVEFIEMWTKATSQREWQPPVGDSSVAAGQRLASVVDHTVHTSPHPACIILVTHGGIIADYLLNMFSAKILNQAMPGFYGSRENSIAECSITIIESTLETQLPKLISLGNTDHLAEVST